MSVGFGFSVGDFIAALELVNDVIDALREANGAGAQFRELVGELNTLKTALCGVEELELDDAQINGRDALQAAAAQCQTTINDFWKTIQKYQTHLRVQGSGSSVKDGWMKIQWAVCKKDDVARFKEKLKGHTLAIAVALDVIQT